MGCIFFDMSEKEARKSQEIVDAPIPRDGLVKFLQDKAGMTRDVAMNTFSELAKLASKGADVFQSMHKVASDSTARSQEKYMDHEAFVARVYEEQLRLESLSQEERRAILENLKDGAKRLYEKDSEHKKFTRELFKLALAGGTALAVLLVLIANNQKGKS